MRSGTDNPSKLMTAHNSGIRKKQADAARASKRAAMTDVQRARHDAGIQKRAATLAANKKQVEEERKLRHAKYKTGVATAAASALEQQKAVHKDVSCLLSEATSTEKEPSPTSVVCGPTKRPRQDGSPAPPAPPRAKHFAALPTLSDLARDTYEAAQMPDMATMGTMAESSTFYANPTTGLGAWGDGVDNGWSHPSGWTGLVETLNRQFISRDKPDWCDDVLNGEYNVVFKPNSLAGDRLRLPPLPEGVRAEDVVLRMTRPDVGKTDSGSDFYRYKRHRNIARELYYTAHAAVNGYGPVVHAAVLFPSVVVEGLRGKRQLYGSLYVMSRATADLNTLINQRSDAIRKTTNNPQLLAEHMKKTGQRVAAAIFPAIFRQSKLGCLNFDTKPANLVFVNRTPLSIDFDAAMFSIVPPGNDGWEGHLLMNLLLLTAHVRTFRHPAFADGWASCVRNLLIELLVRARGREWLQNAQAVTTDFREIHRDTPDAATTRLEMMASAYFVDPPSIKGHTTVFRPSADRNPPPLVHQLARFGLHGSVRRNDAPLESALGDARAWQAVNQ